MTRAGFKINEVGGARSDSFSMEKMRLIGENVE